MASRTNPRRLTMADIERLGPAARIQIRDQLGELGPAIPHPRQPRTQSAAKRPATAVRNPWPVSHVLISVIVLLVSWLAVANAV